MKILVVIAGVLAVVAGLSWAMLAAGLGWYLLCLGIGAVAGIAAGAVTKEVGSMIMEVFRDSRVQTWRPPGDKGGMHTRTYTDE